MNNKKATKRALLTSIMALVMCVVMLVGTTFAWFTDTASTGVNKIQAGNLDVELEYKNSDTAVFTKADKNTEVFKDGALWEPGHVEYVVLKVSNAGSLALKYKLGINIAGETGSTNVLGNEFKLSDYIKFGVVDEDLSGKTRDEMVAAVTDGKLIKGGYTSGETRLYPEVTPAVDGQASEKVVTLVVWMPKSVGNEANHKTEVTAPSIDLGISVAATQDTVEKDSFDNTYDKDAVYPIVAMDTLQELINNAAEPVSAKLEGNIAGSLTVPQDKSITLDLNGFTLTGGDSHAILNRGTLCIKDSSGNGKIVASKANTSALRNAAVCVIEGGTFTRAAGENNKWHTVENFGTMTFNGGKVIAEDGQSFAIVNGWNYIPVSVEQKAIMTINNIDMKAGPNGLKNCAGGTLTMNDGTLRCTGYWGLSNDSTGVATINGGEIISDSYIAISNGGAKMEINGGTFTGPQGSLYLQNYAKDTVIKGGSYQNETVNFIQNYCSAGYTATSENNMVVVRG